MSDPAEQLNPETPPNPEMGTQSPPVELSDEEIFEQEFERRYQSGEPDPIPEPVDPAPTGREPGSTAGEPSQSEGGEPAPSPHAGSEQEPEVPAWYKDLPDEAKEAFDKTATDLATVQDQYTALHGRLAPVQQENARLRTQLETPRPAAGAEPQPRTPPASAAAPATTPGLDLSTVPEFVEFKEAFPEEAKAIEAIFGRQTQHITHLNAQLGEVSQGLERVQSVSLGREREAQLNKLAHEHPDWMTIRPSEDFERWRATQPPQIARMADSPDADECIYILNRYKQDVYLQRQLSQQDAGDPAPAPTPETSAAQATRERRQHLRSVPSLDPQPGNVGLPAGNPDQFLTDEQIWAQEVERRLREQRNQR